MFDEGCNPSDPHYILLFCGERKNKKKTSQAAKHSLHQLKKKKTHWPELLCSPPKQVEEEIYSTRYQSDSFSLCGHDCLLLSSYCPFLSFSMLDAREK
jgi:hypothetical protein